SLNLWAQRPEDGPQTQRTRELHSVVNRLRAVWLRAIGFVARVGASADPRKDLMDVLQLQPSSSTFSIRAAMGRHYFQNLWQFQLVDLGGFGWWNSLEQITSASTQAMGFAGVNGRVKRNLYAAYDVPLKGARVQPGVVTGDTALAPNYI